jgi:secernin
MCDTIAAVASATATGTVIFGKNSDREYNEAQHLQLIPAARHAPGARVRLTYKEIDQAPKTHAVLLSKPHWIWGAEIGANEHGLVIGNEAIFSKIRESLEPGIIGMDYLRLALERATSADEAIHVITTLLRAHGQSGRCGFKREISYHNSYILADPNGARVLETVDREWVVKTVEDYYSISNAMTIGAEFDSSSPTLQSRAQEAGIHANGAPFSFKAVYEDAARVASGCHRHARATQLLAMRSGRLNIPDFFGVLRDHKEGEAPPGRPSGPRICAHTRENPLGQTTAAWVVSLAPGKIVHWVTATSAPCTSLFKPVLMETGVPEHGSRPGAEEDATSLWWRHETLRRQLDESDAATRAAFHAGRDELEARFLKEMEAAPKVDHPQGLHETRRIVAACWRDALEFENSWLAR